MFKNFVTFRTIFIICKLRNVIKCKINPFWLKANTECNRIRYTALKIYYDQTNSNITIQFLTEHFLILQVFYKCSILLPLVMWQTSRWYSNSTHILPKKVTCSRAVTLTILSRISSRSTRTGGMCTLSFTNPQKEKSMGVRLGDLGGHKMQLPWPIHLPVNFNNLKWILWSQMIRLWQFTFPDKWKVASSLKTILSKNKLYSLRQFSISVQKFLLCGRSLGFNSCNSWNVYSRKDNLIRSTLHTVMWEISPSSLLDRRAWTKHYRKDG
jgi:hypothetical protein